MSRPTWQQYALVLARAASERSEDPYKKVGACALNHEGMVLGVGYNGLASGKKVGEDFWKDRDARRPFVIHAEANCLSLFKKGEAKTLAVTLLPCSSCATMIAAYGISEVIYEEDYAFDEKAKDIFDFYGVNLIKL